MNGVGLVLEGGGMRGVYTAGVLEFFMEKELYFPYVIGVSAGACNAASYISRQRGRNKIVTIDYSQDERYLSVKNLIREKSLFGMKFIFEEIPQRLERFDFETFEQSPQKFVIGTTHCRTGKPQYFEKSACQDALAVCRASSSLPFVAPIVEIEGHPLLDGGIVDPIPIKKSIADGNHRNVLILTREKVYRKSPPKGKWVIKQRYRKYPQLAEAIVNRYKVYNETLGYIEKLEESGQVFVIRPAEMPQVDRIEKDYQKLMDLYDKGYEDAERQYESLKAWMDQPDLGKVL